MLIRSRNRAPVVVSLAKATTLQRHEACVVLGLGTTKLLEIIGHGFEDLDCILPGAMNSISTGGLHAAVHLDEIASLHLVSAAQREGGQRDPLLGRVPLCSGRSHVSTLA